MTEVVTGEAVVLDLMVARFPSRVLALLIDVVVQLPVLWFLEVVVLRASAQHLNQAAAVAVYISGFVLVVTGYPLIFETLSRGKSLGKMALGLRVIRDDGGPVGFRQALIRALSLTFIELWTGFNFIGMPAGLVTSLVTKRGKRIGDVFAGTFVIHERAPQRPGLPEAAMTVPAGLAEWAQHLEVARLSDQTAAAASSYLRRYQQLQSPARERLGVQLASAVAAQVSPPPPAGTMPPDYLAAVLAVRREREFARLQSRQAAQAAQAAAAQAAQAAAVPSTVPATEPIEDTRHSAPLDSPRTTPESGFAAPA